jgi:hypothetical protein
VYAPSLFGILILINADAIAHTDLAHDTWGIKPREDLLAKLTVQAQNDIQSTRFVSLIRFGVVYVPIEGKAKKALSCGS